METDFSLTPIYKELSLKKGKIEERLLGVVEIPSWKTIILDLVKKNKLDPWNIDISLLTDKYVEYIKKIKEENLIVSANAILLASLLLRLKASYLRKGLDEILREYGLEQKKGEEAVLADIRVEDYSLLQKAISKKEGKEGGISLDDLVKIIEKTIQEGEKRVLRLKKYRPTIDRAAFMHTEKIEKIMPVVLKKIKKLSKKLRENVVLFSVLSREQSLEEKIDYFTAILYLVSENKILAWQDSIFGEIYIEILGAGS